MPTLPPVVPRPVVAGRLNLIFPAAAIDAAAYSPIAAAAVAAMLYMGAVVDDGGDISAVTLVRPSMCLWMSDAVLTHHTDRDRQGYVEAALQSKKRHEEFVQSLGETFAPWYGDNSRETLRDETFAEWERVGAIRSDPAVPTTSPRPRWALTASFASLFDPALNGKALGAAVEAWEEEHLGPGAMVKIRTAAAVARSSVAVRITLPDGSVRQLAPGASSEILRGVVEQWAVQRLGQPVVLAISEPGDKVHLAEGTYLKSLGITMHAGGALPDAVIADVVEHPVRFWLVEAVGTDGAVTGARKAELLAWAATNGIAPKHCEFLSAFVSRRSPPARKRLPDLADGTYAWFLDEPNMELAWNELGSPG